MTSKTIIDALFGSAAEKGFIATLLVVFIAGFFYFAILQNQRISQLEDRMHDMLVDEIAETRQVVEKNNNIHEQVMTVMQRLERKLDHRPN